MPSPNTKLRLPKIHRWFRDRPLENTTNTFETLRDLFRTIISGIQGFSTLLQGLAAIPIVGVVLLAIGNLLKSFTVMFDKNVSPTKKALAIGINVTIVTLATLAVIFSGASFGFAFVLAAASIGLAAELLAVGEAINNWRNAKNALSNIEELKALEEQYEALEKQHTQKNNPPSELVRVEKRLQIIYQQLGVKNRTDREAKVSALDEKIIALKDKKLTEEAALISLKKYHPTNSNIPILKKSIAALEQKINISKQTRQKYDTRPKNIEKLKDNVRKAKTNIYSNIAAAAIATAVILVAVVALPLLAPTLPVVAGVIAGLTVALAAVNFIYGAACRYFSQKDKDEKATKKTAKLANYTDQGEKLSVNLVQQHIVQQNAKDKNVNAPLIPKPTNTGKKLGAVIVHPPLFTTKQGSKINHTNVTRMSNHGKIPVLPPELEKDLKALKTIISAPPGVKNPR